MLSVVACLVLGFVLVAAAGLKLSQGPAARAALETYGIRSAPLARAVWAGLIGVEAVLGVGVAAGLTWAAEAAALLMAGACAAQLGALTAGRGGGPGGGVGAGGPGGGAAAGRGRGAPAGVPAPAPLPPPRAPP